jgi:hypothetical protein
MNFSKVHHNPNPEGTHPSSDDDIRPHFRLDSKQQLSATLSILQAVSRFEGYIGNSKFLSCRKDESSFCAYLVLNIVFTTYYFLNMLWMTSRKDLHGHAPGVAIASSLISALFGWSLAALACGNQLNMFSKVSSSSELIHWLERFWVIFIIVSLDSMNIYFIQYLVHQCNDESVQASYNTLIISSSHMVATICIPTLLFTCIKTTSLREMALLIIVNLVLNIGLVAYADILIAIGALVFFSLFSIFMLLEYNRQSLVSFTLGEKLHQTIALNERMKEEIQARELRHMIGNIAHDLKTVGIPSACCFTFINVS